MPNCNAIVGIPGNCDDNNVGSIKTAWIASYDDVTSYTASTGSEVTAITMDGATLFEEFSFKKNTSNYTENWMGDLTADVHLWTQSIVLGLRRIEVSKRNAISLLAEGRRNLIIIVLDNNGQYRIFGLDDGLRLSAMESGTNETRAAGTFYTITFTGEEKWMAYDFDGSLLAAITA